jgi:hypothetical protein
VCVRGRQGVKDSLIATAGSFRAHVVKAEFTKRDST